VIVRRLAAHFASVVGAFCNTARFRVVATGDASRVTAPSLLVDVRIFDVRRATRRGRSTRDATLRVQREKLGPSPDGRAPWPLELPVLRGT
jgi:hypothetical protein